MQIPRRTRRRILVGIASALLLTAVFAVALRIIGATDGWISFWGAILGGLIGGGTTLLAAVVAWESTKAALEDGRLAREKAEIAKDAEIYNEQRDALILARSFVQEVKANASKLIDPGQFGSKRYRMVPDSHRILSWLVTLGSDPIASQAMSLPPVHCRIRISSAVRRAIYSAEIVLENITTIEPINHGNLVEIIERIGLACDDALIIIANSLENVEVEMRLKRLPMRATN